MGIFKKSKNTGVPITLQSAIGGTLTTAAQFLNGVAEDKSISDEDIYLVWSVLYISGIAYTDTDTEREYLTDYLSSQIVTPKLKKAFRKEIDNPQSFLYSKFDDDALKRQKMISFTLAEEITKKALARSKTVTKEELAINTNEIFSHFLNQSHLEPKETHEIMTAVLAGCFAWNIEDICRRLDFYGFESSKKRITVAESIFSRAFLLYVIREISQNT
jgi:hypothetical protein